MFGNASHATTIGREPATGDRLIAWAGWIIVAYGAAHTIGGLTVEGAASHAGVWVSGGLWHEDFTAMSAAHSAYWFTLASFGPPLVLIGALVVWMNRRGITPPAFLAWTLLALTLVDVVVLIVTPWPIILTANILLLMGIRRSTIRRTAAAGTAAVRG